MKSDTLKRSSCGYILMVMVMVISNFGMVQLAVAQNQNQVAGQVVDSLSGESLPGVNVLLKGTKTGTSTDLDGNYELTVSSLQDTLIFSFVGYVQKEVAISGRTEIDMQLQSETVSGDELVVVGYGTQEKESLVGSQISVEPQELQTAPVRNLSTSLAGKIAGVVSVQRSGAPGYDDADIWIRGISTFDQNLSQPLVLVDGVPRDYNDIDPEDIESFSILKDASATAVYGVRGANGVILINTKSGSAGKPKFEFRYNQGITELTKRPNFADGPTYMLTANEALINRGDTPRYSDEAIRATREQTDPYLYPNVDWYKEIFRDYGSNRQFSLNINGGSDVAVYYVSASYFNETGLYRTDELTKYNSQQSLTRYNMTSNLTLKPTNTTELKLGAKGFLSTGNFPGTPGDVIYNNTFYSTPIIHPPKYPDGKTANPPGGTITNPYALLTQRGYVTNARNQLYSDLRLTQDLDFWIEGLSLTSMFSFDAYNFVSQRREKDPDTYIANNRNSEDELNYQETNIGQEFLGYSRNNEGNRSTYLEASLRYNNDFGRHNVGGMVLFNQSDETFTHTNDFIASLPHRLRGLAGRANYAYDDRYFLEFNFGYNGSENFAPEQRYGFFPSVGAGWTISNEDFFKPADNVFQFLKFRFSYGLVGSSDIPGRRFAYLATVANTGGYTYGQSLDNYIGGRAVGEYAANVTWEESTKTNIGLDLWTLDHTLNLQVDAFKEHRTGIFLRRDDLPHYVGITSNPYGNVGVVDNKGIDASLQYQGNIGNVNLQLLGNFNFNRNKVVEDNLPAWEYPWLEREGRKVGQRFGYIALGLFENEAEIANAPEHAGDIRPGDVRYKDINGDGMIGPDDRFPIGYGSIPEITYGFGFTAGYKGFTLSTFFQGVGNVDIYLSGEGLQPFQRGLNRGNLYSNIDDRWSPENPDSDAFYPRLMVGSLNDNYIISTKWLQNGRYIRMKNAELNYTLPAGLTQKMHIRSAEIFLSGVNLLTFSPFKLWDVELGNGRGAAYPLTTTYSAGIELNF